MDEEFKMIEGVDLDDKNVEIEMGEMIEYEVSDSISILYDKATKNYFIDYIDYSDTCDEFTIDLDDTFNGIEIEGTYISKEDFIDFKNLVEKVA